ncbi:MAG: hypothetical protein ABIZ56_11585 [Chthoniobacteraceae bacterium]
MIPRNRSSPPIIIALCLGALTVAIVFGEVSLLDRPKGHAAKVIFSARANSIYNIQGIPVLRSVASTHGKNFTITPVRFTGVAWRGDALTTFSDCWGAFWNPSLFALRVYDVDPQVACNSANTIAVKAQEFCQEEFDRRESVWLSSLTPEQYRLETMGPWGSGGCGAITIWEAASNGNPPSQQ